MSDNIELSRMVSYVGQSCTAKEYHEAQRGAQCIESNTAAASDERYHSSMWQRPSLFCKHYSRHNMLLAFPESVALVSVAENCYAKFLPILFQKLLALGDVLD